MPKTATVKSFLNLYSAVFISENFNQRGIKTSRKITLSQLRSEYTFRLYEYI